ncbi:MAG: ornithine carbamoyltransferase [Thermodesulfobacteriota bacterium]|nr:ornithine carbamoyltransferase [Thermodesulfobacteriota bacterium]
MQKDFLRILDFNTEELEEFILLAIEIKEKFVKKIFHKPLVDRTLGMIFDNPSTRTRISFEVGMLQLGGHAISLNSNDIQLSRGETIQDTARIISRFLDAIVIRTPSHEVVEILAKHADIPVINGLTERFHPCQILSDIFTIKEKKGYYKGIHIAYIGDGNNVANSWISAALRLKFHLTLACPEGFRPNREVLETAGKYAETEIQVIENPYDAVSDADIIYTDVWVSMGQDSETKKRKEVFSPYQINSNLVEKAKKDVLIMHCLPAHRGEEITSQVMDGKNSIIIDQAENRLHLQKAILEILLTRNEKNKKE